jgi:hypothetical protein
MFGRFDAGQVKTPSLRGDQSEAQAGRGLDYAILYFPEVAYERSGLDLFARQVAPHLAGK